MANWLSDLFAGGVTGVVDSVASVADRFITTSDERQAFRLEAEAILQQRDSEIEQTIRAELGAKERVLVAELSQGDNFTKRARPMVVYAGLVMIGVNYVLFPLIARFVDSADTSALPLPTEFWAAWGGIVSTWVIGRSAEKRGARNPVVQAITGSSSRLFS